MSAEQIQERIIQNLIQSSPIPLKSDPAIRQKTNGPDLAFYMLCCKECKTNWVRISFTQGQEETWETEAQSRLDQHLVQFHKGEA